LKLKKSYLTEHRADKLFNAAHFTKTWGRIMRIIIVGQGPFGEKALDALIRNGEDIVGVFCPKNKSGEAMKELADSASIDLFQPEHMRDIHVHEAYRDLKPDLVVLAFVTDILPESLLDIPSIGTICYHPSLLPRHRGSSGINWAVIQGDTRTGLTILWADKGIDTGAILLQKEIDIAPDDTTGTLYFNKLFPMGIEAIVEAVELIKAGDAPKIKQDESLATYEPPCDETYAGIDWSKTPPGQIISIGDDAVIVALNGGALKVGKMKGEKGAKISADEFARGAGLEAGMRFGE
jgi:methionyl-tRNA formyltransferase